jgi:hypothetical protein
MTLLLIVIEAVATVIVLVRAVVVFNKMSTGSCVTIAVAWLGLAGAALSSLLDLWFVPRSPDLHTVALVAAVAWLALFERRRIPW